MRLAARIRSWWRTAVRPANLESEMEIEMQAHLEAHAEYLRSTGIPPEEAAAARAGNSGPGTGERGLPGCPRRQPPAFTRARSGFRTAYAAQKPGVRGGFHRHAGAGDRRVHRGIQRGEQRAAARPAVPRSGEPGLSMGPNPRLEGVPLEAFGPPIAIHDLEEPEPFLRRHGALHRIAQPAGRIRRSISSSRVTGEFFETLGIAPNGPSLGPNDDRPGSERVAVISHALWQSQFAEIGRCWAAG